MHRHSSAQSRVLVSILAVLPALLLLHVNGRRSKRVCEGHNGFHRVGRGRTLELLKTHRTHKEERKGFPQTMVFFRPSEGVADSPEGTGTSAHSDESSGGGRATVVTW